MCDREGLGWGLEFVSFMLLGKDFLGRRLSEKGEKDISVKVVGGRSFLVCFRNRLGVRKVE